MASGVYFGGFQHV